MEFPEIQTPDRADTLPHLFLQYVMTLYLTLPFRYPRKVISNFYLRVVLDLVNNLLNLIIFLGYCNSNKFILGSWNVEITTP